MSLKTMTLQPEVANVATYLGTNHTFAEDGVVIPNGLHLVDTAVADFRSRPALTFRSRIPVYDKKTNDYSKDKKSITLTVPYILPSGKTVFNTMRIEREVHPDCQNMGAFGEASTVHDVLNTFAIQLLLLPDTEQYWLTGSLS